MKLIVTTVFLSLLLVGSAMAGLVNPPDVAYLGATQASSSQAGFDKSQAVDGIINGTLASPNEWTATGYTGWLQVDLGQAYYLTDIVLYGMGLGTETFNVYAGASSFVTSGALNGNVIPANLLIHQTETGAFQLTITGLSSTPIEYILFNVPSKADSQTADWANLEELEADVPEPGTLAFVGGALLAFGFCRRRRA